VPATKPDNPRAQYTVKKNLEKEFLLPINGNLLSDELLAKEIFFPRFWNKDFKNREIINLYLAV
jgi:hypothetical protein